MKDLLQSETESLPFERKPLPFERIRLDGGTQTRKQLNQGVVDNYAVLMTEGAVFPPAVVFHDGTDNWMADGFHRYWAAKQAGKEDLLCEVRQGTVEDARWFALGANKAHGLRHTTEDKRRAVEAALKAKPDLSDRAIALHVGVDHKTVAAARKRAEGEIPQADTRTGLDGRKRPAAGHESGDRKAAGKQEPRNVTGACAELNRLVKSGKVERMTAERLVRLLPDKPEQQRVAEAGAEEVKRTVAVMSARREWLRRAESWQSLVRSKHYCPTERAEAAGPLLAKDKDHVLAALTEARDAISKWITTIEGWPVEPASATCASS